MSVSILWFRRNLRLADNLALANALASGHPVLPVYVVDDLDSGGASRWWLHHSLASLDAAIGGLGGKMRFFAGDPAALLADLAAKTGATNVYAAQRYEPAAREQEHRLRDALDSSIDLQLVNDSLLNAPGAVTTQSGSAYKVFTPFYKTASSRGEPPTPAPAPTTIRWAETGPESLTLEELGLLPTKPDWAGGLREAWSVGEDAAHERLEGISDKIRGYADGRDIPADDATSRLSPHLHFGEISPRQVWHGVMNHARQGGQEDAAEPFIRQLYWRDFSADLLFYHPSLPTEPLREEFDAFPWREDEQALEAWQRGRTGYPIVDAGMRQLWHTGWMHNRVRMIAASLLVKHLLVPWQRGADWFLDTLVDADLANNSAGWQWVAGCGTDAAPYFRIFNPITQGKKFDPDGSYVRQWVPELRDMPAEYIHEPWTADSFTQQTSGVEIGKDYPEPIIAHKAGRERALEAYQVMRDR